MASVIGRRRGDGATVDDVAGDCLDPTAPRPGPRCVAPEGDLQFQVIVDPEAHESCPMTTAAV
jgi:hypothetical protein